MRHTRGKVVFGHQGVRLCKRPDQYLSVHSGQSFRLTGLVGRSGAVLVSLKGIGGECLQSCRPCRYHKAYLLCPHLREKDQQSYWRYLSVSSNYGSTEMNCLAPLIPAVSRVRLFLSFSFRLKWKAPSLGNLPAPPERQQLLNSIWHFSGTWIKVWCFDLIVMILTPQVSGCRSQLVCFKVNGIIIVFWTCMAFCPIDFFLYMMAVNLTGSFMCSSRRY